MDYWSRLLGVDPRLVAPVTAGAFLFEAAYPKWFVRVTSGKRSQSEQDALVRQGKSPIRNSKHVLGLAIDLAICNRETGEYCSWDMEEYALLNAQIQAQADLMNQQVIWGGDWKSKDGVHWELVAPSLASA